MIKDVLGNGVKIVHPDLVNLYGCVIGDEKVGTFVEVQKGVTIGRRCKISSHNPRAVDDAGHPSLRRPSNTAAGGY